QMERTVPHGVRHRWRRVGADALQPGCERRANIPELFGGGRWSGRAAYFYFRSARSTAQAEINQVQVKHRKEHVREVFGDLIGLVAGPNGGKRRKGDQISHGAAKGACFAGNWFHRSPSSQPPSPYPLLRLTGERVG